MEQFNFSGSHGIHVKTYCPILKYTFKWTIENYSEILLDTEVKSSEFSVEPQSVWSAELIKRNNDFVFKIFRHCDMLPVKIIYKFYINDSEGMECYMCEDKLSVTSKCFSLDIARNSNYSWSDSLNLIKKAKNDTLVFTVLIEVLHTRVNEVITCSKINEDVAITCLKQNLLQRLSVDLKKILDNRIKPDLVLRVQEQKIDVHRAILSARSPVFDKMLQQEGMSETELNEVDIVDVTMPVLKELVAYLYSGEMKDYDFQTAMELYYAADKYEVLELREVCARVLSSKMTLDYTLKVLNLAEMHQNVILKSEVMQFIKTHYKP